MSQFDLSGLTQGLHVDIQRSDGNDPASHVSEFPYFDFFLYAQP
jgi:hypothetical protein